MPIGLIRLISTQKVLKTCINKGAKYHFLDSNKDAHKKIPQNKP